MHKKQTGFSAVLIMVIIFVVGLIGAAGWLAYSRQNKSTESEKKSSEVSSANDTDSQETIPAGYDTYEMKEGSYSFYYPKDWTAELTEVKDDADFVNIYKASTKGNPYMTISSSKKSPTNTCSSEVSPSSVSVMVANMSGFQYDSDSRGDFRTSTCFVKDDNIYVITYHYDEGTKSTEIKVYNTIISSFSFK